MVGRARGQAKQDVTSALKQIHAVLDPDQRNRAADSSGRTRNGCDMSRLWILLLRLGVIAGYGNALHRLRWRPRRVSSWSCHHDK
jgi:hypothetical protein